MKLTVLCLSFYASAAQAHYYWPWFFVNGTQFAQWKYVRDVAMGDEYEQGTIMAKAEPLIDLFSTNFTCGRLAFASAKKTETADVVAGTEVGFRVNQGMEEPDAFYSGVNHAGPVQVYLAKPPTGVALEDFSGIDGDWFKIVSLAGLTDSDWWLNDYTHRIVNFTIPAYVPPGKYLLRFEQFWPNTLFKQTQFFINCAHVNIMGTGSGSLDGYPFAKFPGTYDYMDPAIYASKDIADYPHKGLLSYVGPGPAVWKG